MKKLLEIKNISKNYHTLNGEIEAIDNINLSVYKNEFISIVGSSGSGKSTLLNILADLDTPSNGSIIKPNNIIISYMLQDDALFPWLNILDNASLGLKITKKNTKENIEYVKYLLKKYGLEEFIYKYPYELSGGMKKRVALIRTLAIKPDILLLDEPFSALDYQSRLAVADDVYKIIKQEKKTVIMITHDIAEALALSNRVVVFSSRPAVIKNIYDIKLDKIDIPSRNRKDKKFFYYYDLIWKDLDKFV